MGGLDINWFRQDKGYNPDVIRESLKKRFRDPALVDEIIKQDHEWRQLRYKIDMLNKQWNEIQKIVKEKKKANKEDPCAQEMQQKAVNQAKKKAIEQEQNSLLKKIDKLVNSVGNIVHESVPVSNNEDENQVIRKWGQIPNIKITGKKGGFHHHQVLQAIGGFDPERGNKIAGHRGYFLKGYGVLLNQALINYGLKFLHQQQYQLVQPPFFLKKEIMAETCQLSDFDDQLYKVTAGTNEDDQYYLIATSQQPISAMHRGEWIEEATLPIKYAGISSCFRKEAGAHGKDNWGIFRVHQFEKVEQFMITKPEDSWAAHQEMIKQSQIFYQSLELPYQVISIVSGALNDAAAKKYDLEAWFPGYGAYRELVSSSNCTDFQSRNLQIRCGLKKKDVEEKRYVHMLNGTLTATERTLCCILENYQTQNGLRVPKVLQQYVGTDFIPYLEEKKKEKKVEPPKKKQTEPKKPKEPKEQKEPKGQPNNEPNVQDKQQKSQQKNQEPPSKLQ